MQLYHYDLSEFSGDRPNISGRFSVGRYFDAYWREPERHPFLIGFGDKLAGLALVREFEPGKFSVAEFFVLKVYRRQGVGQRAATLLFDTFRGEWHVAQEIENLPAQRFWRTVIIGSYSGNDFWKPSTNGSPEDLNRCFAHDLPEPS